ncbi:MAG: nucleoside-diphosphate kinase [Bacteroidia bacterium]|nr:nucleoside-diphosphate kinase [Bacteroidia bacterium]
MSGKITFTIIKPDAVGKGHTGKIIDQIIQAGFKVKAAKLVYLDERTAGGFYDIHRERPFFKDLVAFMTSGPCMPMVLEGENAVASFRELIGATDPKKAAPGTIRNLFADSIDANAIHGSDSDENALRESSYFFAATEIF